MIKMTANKLSNETPIFHLTVGEFLALIRHEQKTPETNSTQIPEIFGIKTLQELTNYSKPAIYAKTSKKEIPHFRRDGRLFFRKDEIMEWLMENPVTTTSEHCRTMDEQLVKVRRGRR